MSTWLLVQTYSGHGSNVYGLEFINEATIASSGVFDLAIKTWSIATGETLKTINVTEFVNSIKVLSNGIHLAAGLISGNINIYNLNTGGLISTLIGHTNWIEDLILTNTSNI